MFQALSNNYILCVSLLSWLAAQICKTILNFILCGELNWERMFGAGGMPTQRWYARLRSQRLANTGSAPRFSLLSLCWPLLLCTMQWGYGARRASRQKF